MLLFRKCFLLFGTSNQSKLRLSPVLELVFINRTANNHPSLAHYSSVNGMDQFRGLYLQSSVYFSIAVGYKLAALCTLANMFSLNFAIKVSLLFKFSIVGFFPCFLSVLWTITIQHYVAEEKNLLILKIYYVAAWACFAKENKLSLSCIQHTSFLTGTMPEDGIAVWWFSHLHCNKSLRS